MLVLIGCEESQAICIALREKGIEAYSCDLLPCSGDHPEWHFQMDVLRVIKGGTLTTQSGHTVNIKKWDAGIFHPECTYLTVSGLHWNYKYPDRAAKTEEALLFVRDLMNADIDLIAIENPVGCISTRIFRYVGDIGPERWEVFPRKLDHGGRKPDQIIQPYQFGEDASKATCLWLKGFPKLVPTKYFEPRITNDGKKRWGNQTDSGQNKLPPSPQRKQLRSKTYDGIAQAIAIQWFTQNNQQLKAF